MEEYVTTDYYLCTRCKKPCEALHLREQSISVCCRVKLEVMRNTRVKRAELPVTHYLHQTRLVSG